MKYLSILVLALLCMCCSTPKPQVEIADLFDRYYEESLLFNPINATYAGDNRYNDLLPNFFSQEYIADLKDFYNRYKTELLTYDRATLSSTDQLSYDILLWELDMGLEGLDYPTELLPINQIFSFHLSIGQLASGSSAQPFKTVEDYDNWLSRLEGFVALSDTAMANMKKGMAQGYVLPKALTDKIIPQLQSFATDSVEANLFYTPVTMFPEGFSPDNVSRLKQAYYKMVSEKIIPTYARFADFVINDYAAASRESSGIDAIPNGRAYYDYQIKYFTTTTMTADEIFALGQSEVARIREEMEKVKAQVGFEGDLNAFFDHVRNKPELMPFTDPQQVIDNFNAIHEKMKPNLEKLFDRTPKTQFEVRRTEAFRESSASAEYNPGTKDGSRPGIFYVPIPDVKSYNVYSDEDLFLHEAIPGHHYQISLQQENQDLPEFRKTLWYSAYGEGWALYTESLGSELGLYEDPYQYFGMLSAEMHRAIRLVVDAGMHTQGWTREQAIQFSLENEAESEESIIAEIERYMAGPGQALSYKIGQLKIRELRAKAVSELGDKFDIRAFHNEVLESGCLPIKVLEDKINAWIAEVKAA
ncbi:MAG: hypothetical protein ACJAVY_001426 [Marinoscillum sp.]|jgi:uncharacterized protein (DUF885 family)